MDDRAGRWLSGVALLVGVWIVVYWLWEPGRGGEPAGGVGPVVRVEEGASDEPGGAVGDPGGLPAGESLPVAVGAGPDDDAAGEGGGVEAPRFRSYTVREGETMQRIALREYGSVNRWTVIARANPLLDPNRLRPGRVIRLPVDPGNVQGRAVEPGGGGAGAAGAGVEGDGVESDAGEPAAVIEYRVERGDTLSGIASRFYGSSRWTDFLFQANRDRLRSPGAIRIGQTLVIPPKPAGDGP